MVDASVRKSFRSKACKGIDKMLEELRPDGIYGSHTVLAVYDGDRIRRHLKLRHDCADADVNQEIVSRGGPKPRRLEARSIGHNLEALVATMATIQGNKVSPSELQVIRDKPGGAQLVRDKVLCRHADDKVEMLTFRRDLEASMPTWRDIVDVAVAAFRDG